MTGELSATAAAGLLDAFAALSEDGVFAFDDALRVLVWNHGMEAMFGTPAAAALGRDVLEVLPFLVATGGEHRLRDALAGKTTTTRDEPFHIDGHDGVLDGRYGPWTGGGVGIVRDVTERRRLEDEARETEQRFRNMADAAPVLLWMSRTDSLCTFFNQSWLDFTGRTLAEEWGVGWAEGVHFEDLQACLDTYADAFNRREVFEMEYRLRRADGEYRWILDRGTPRYTPDGAFAGYIGSCIDITDRKRLETDLRASIRAREEFLSIASHELRTPLSATTMRLERLGALLSRPDAADRLVQAASDARAAARRAYDLGDMIDMLFDASRIAEGRLVIESKLVDLSSLVTDAVERVRDLASASAVELRPQIQPLLATRGDAFRLRQVVVNLLGNAIRHGAGQPVTVSLERIDDRLVMAVADDGPGVPPEHQQRIFERFVRLGSPTHHGGFGLGLWISREVIDRHGGTIRVENVARHGARFVVELPCSTRTQVV